MAKVKELDIKNQTYYFLNDIIDIRNFHSNLLKIDKKPYKDIDIYYIGYITIKKFDDCENIHSVNPLYLAIYSSAGYFKERNGEKYLSIGVNTDDNVPLNKKLKFPSLTIIIRCAFQNGKKLYPQVYLDECLYEL